MNRTRLLPLALTLAVLPACSDGAATTPETVEMTESQDFRPEPATVAAGTTVAFVNESSQAHTVTAYDGGIPAGAEYFASGGFDDEDEARANLAEGLVGQEGTYEVTFDVPGTYEFFCIPHEEQGMKGTIVVEEG